MNDENIKKCMTAKCRGKFYTKARSFKYQIGFCDNSINIHIEFTITTLQFFRPRSLLVSSHFKSLTLYQLCPIKPILPT